MSTIVSYKGNTIATVENNTKTLTTAGKYVEADIILTDVTDPSSMTVIRSQDSHGGTIVTITGEEIVLNLQTKNVTPSTSPQTITPDSGYDALSQVNVAAVPDGNNIEYGITDGTLPLAGVATAGSAVI